MIEQEKVLINQVFDRDELQHLDIKDAFSIVLNDNVELISDTTTKNNGLLKRLMAQ